MLADRHRLPGIADVATVAGAAIAAAALIAIVVDIVVRGAPGLSLEFLVAAPEDAGRGGGIGPILVATALILLVATAVATPLALGAALHLTETRSRAGRLVGASLDALASVPSIVFGLFGNAVFTHLLGLGFSILSGGLTLACMILPYLTRVLEQGLAAVPDRSRRGAAALGLSRSTTLVRIVLPAALPSLGIGLTLGIGRALAETAALIFTSGYVVRMPTSLLDSGRALSVHVYDLALNVPGGGSAAWSAALVLAVALVVINGVALRLPAVLLRNGGRR